MSSIDKNDKRETVDDILAETERESIIHVCIPAIDLERYVKRIKAAWKWERAKVESDALDVGGIVEAARTAEKSSAVGNAAAMRDALVKIRDKCVIYNNDLAEEIDALCGNALSAPARNCDRFSGDYVMLHTAWSDWTGSPSGRLPDGTAKMTFAAWLLAPAAERKGEYDGR